MLYNAFLVVKVYDYMEEKTESILGAKESVVEAFESRDETAIKPAKEKKRLDCYGRKEYLRRMCDKDFAELPEDTREVFETIDPEVVEMEEAANKCYVYLTKDMYNKLELGRRCE